jgi:hypothetical protein
MPAMIATARYVRRRAVRALFVGTTVVALVAVDGHAGEIPLVAGVVPSATTGIGRYADFVTEAASLFSIPARLIDAVIEAESFGDATATSPKGAMGLMQIMPRTWADLRARYALGANPYDPHDNILAGAAYLRELYDRYGPDGFLAAYNAGPGRYEEFLTTGRTLPPETLTYVVQVTSLIGEGSARGVGLATSSSSFWTTSRLFTVCGENKMAAAQTTAAVSVDRTPAAQQPQSSFRLAPQSAGLFVPLSRKGAQP